MSDGYTWIKTSAPTEMWSSICTSSSGDFLAACFGQNGHIYTSSDNGNTWTQRAQPKYWSSICCSSSGQYLAACVGNNATFGYIYTSSDYGSNWTQTSVSN